MLDMLTPNSGSDSSDPRWDIRATLGLGAVFGALAWAYGSAGDRLALALIGVCMVLIGIILVTFVVGIEYEY